MILVGFGVVGSSAASILVDQRDILRRMYGLNPRILAIANIYGAVVERRGIDFDIVRKIAESGADMEKIAGDAWHPKLDALNLIDELDADVMIEVTPTNLDTGEPGLTHITRALKNGMHVVTTNKGPLAIAMPALLELAEHNRVSLKFSGTVGGGTPMIDFAKKCLDGLQIESMRGILNGTTNYMLTKMNSEGISFDAALQEAREKGYAEADPSYDIDGLDAAAKLVIMANWVMGRSVSIRDLKITGIRDLKRDLIERANSEGKSVKLIAQCGDSMEVAPMAIPRDHPLNVSGTMNALTFSTDSAGEITIVGRGAGGMETASAVLRDLINIRKGYARRASSPGAGLRRA